MVVGKACIVLLCCEKIRHVTVIPFEKGSYVKPNT